MVIPINKRGGRGHLLLSGRRVPAAVRRLGVTQISLEARTRRQDAEKAFWGGSVRWVDDPTGSASASSIGTGSKAFGARNHDDLLPMPAARRIAADIAKLPELLCR